MPPSTTPARARSAFTLIELLTVIAIIGILAAILIPTVGKVRESARASQCVSNMRQAATSLTLYANDNKGLLPAALNPAGQDGDPNIREWSQAIRAYLPGKNDATGTRHAVLTCPSNNYDAVSGNSVPVSHTYAMGAGAMALNEFNNDRVLAGRRALTSIRNPTQAVWLWESGITNNTFKIPNSGVGRQEMQDSFAAPTGTGRVAFWHGGGARTNVAFADASVRAFSAPELRERYPAGNEGYRKAAGL